MATPANALPAVNSLAPEREIHGACPVCQSPIHVEGGIVKGGGESEFFQNLSRKADSADEWRTKFEESERRIPPATPAPTPPETPAPPEPEKVSFF